jgi:hypothetical protein
MSDYDPYGEARKPPPDTTEQSGTQKTDRRATREAEKKPAVPTRTEQASAAVRKARTMIAQAVWAVAVLFAVILAGGALCVALKANPDNNLVQFLVDTADKLDFGVFETGSTGIYHATGDTHEALTKNALVNWGIAAVVWLILGGVVSKIIRPKDPAAQRRTA